MSREANAEKQSGDENDRETFHDALHGRCHRLFAATAELT
jgi:hypothetical protein